MFLRIALAIVGFQYQASEKAKRRRTAKNTAKICIKRRPVFLLNRINLMYNILI
jgi:hypothetical protein